MDPQTCLDRIAALRISLHPGSRIVPGEEGTVIELPIWYARRGRETATGETPLEAVDKLVQALGGVSVSDQVEARTLVRSTEPRADVGT